MKIDLLIPILFTCYVFRNEMNLKISLQNVLSCIESNEIVAVDYEPVCTEVDSVATKELLKDENFGNFVAGR